MLYKERTIPLVEFEDPAAELGYPDTVVKRVRKADNEVDISNIMWDARHGRF